MTHFRAGTDPSVSERERKNQAAVRALAPECMVLLENDGTMPIGKDTPVALFGNGARGTVKGGTGSGDVYVRDSVNVEEGLLKAGFSVVSGAWLDRQKETGDNEYNEWRAEVLRQAEAQGIPERSAGVLNPYCPKAVAPVTEADLTLPTDTAVYVLSRNSGEGMDRRAVPGDYYLTEQELLNIRVLSERYAKFVLLLNVGGIIDLAEVKKIPTVNAMVLMSQAGNTTGLAVADLLAGTTFPSGHLTDTWAADYADYPSSKTFGMNDGDVDDEYYKEGIFTGYRYFDTFGVKPIYEFGYGLTYTDFRLTAGEPKVEGGRFLLDVTVKNIGEKFAGREVVQIYVSSPAGKLEKPYQELRAYKKTGVLKPGQEETLAFSLDIASFASYNEEISGRILEEGEYIARVGESSRKTSVAAVITLSETVVTETMAKLFADPEGKMDELSRAGAVPFTYANEAAEIGSAKRVAVDPKAFTVRKAVYTGANALLEDKFPGEKITMLDVVSGKHTPEELAAQLRPDELVRLVCGNVREDNFSSADAIGQASFALPGSAGENTYYIKDREFRPTQMVDGPAGLRLTPVFYETPEGMGLKKEQLLEAGIPVEDCIARYQYCTAIPIASLLASSWDEALLEKCGDIVGSEMEEFGATLWLAPGMNNHRNPLCGRNFEYYSEDPLVTGRSAAAITRGVQKHPGYGTTIKHFAANNQEDNRMFTNSHIGERAIREIYLRSFEIAVREAQPMAIMTSYNILNGTHTANNDDLIHKVLRDEWGFKGMVMTDWLTTSSLSRSFYTWELKYDKSYSGPAMKAGNDLLMPATPEELKELTEEYEKDHNFLADLQACGARIIRLMAGTHLFEGAAAYDGKIGHENISFR